jgi:hypothetical protein
MKKLLFLGLGIISSIHIYTMDMYDISDDIGDKHAAYGNQLKSMAAINNNQSKLTVSQRRQEVTKLETIKKAKREKLKIISNQLTTMKKNKQTTTPKYEKLEIEQENIKEEIKKIGNQIRYL